MSPSPGAPEQKARAQIDAALIAAGWVVQNRDTMNLSAGDLERRAPSREAR